MGVVILDTDVIIDLYRNKREALKTLDYFKDKVLTISPISYAEFLGGTRLKYKIEARKFLHQFKVLHEKENQKLFALCMKHEFKKQRSDKRNSSLGDFLIAQDTLKANTILVTQNIDDFTMFESIKLHEYKISSWF